jgi:hypothetical protein
LAEIAGMFEKKQLTIPVGSVLPFSEARRRARDDGGQPALFARQDHSCSRRLTSRAPNTLGGGDANKIHVLGTITV